MRYISTFSGIEAASAAWEPLGWEPVAFSEIEPFPCAVLAHRYPHVPNLGDITKADWSGYRGAVDIVVGGSPCQSFSVAGGRESLRGESRLMFEYIRCVEDVVPRWLLWENVPGVLSTGDNAFGCLLGALSELGYCLAWRVLDAQFFGVAQRRRRVFLVGHLGGGAAPAAVLFDAESVRGNTVTSREKRAELAAGAGIRTRSCGFAYNAAASAGGVGLASELSPTLKAEPYAAVAVSNHGDIAVTLTARHDSSASAGSGQTVVAVAQNQRGELRIQGDGSLSGALSANPGMKQATYVMASGQSGAEVSEGISPTLSAAHEQPVLVYGPPRRLTPLECERLQGFPDGWTDVPYRGREHPADAPRYKALGNSMAVPVMRWIGERI